MTNPRTVTLHARYRTVGTLPVAAALVVGINGLYVLLVAFGNIREIRHQLRVRAARAVNGYDQPRPACGHRSRSRLSCGARSPAGGRTQLPTSR